jgi:L-Ala-D/L-Glu epimerase
VKLTLSKVEVFEVTMPLTDTFTSGGVSKDITKCVAIRIIASNGAEGISSIDPSARARSPNTAPEIAASIRDKIAPVLLGQDPTNIHLVLATALAQTPTQPGAAAAVELACIDLVCRHLGIGVADYLGGALTRDVRFNGWIGELGPEEAAAEGKRWLNAGFKSAKIKVGSGVAADHDRVAAVREAVGSEFELRMDANEQYAVDGALELCAAVREYNLQLFEQPVIADDLSGLAQIRKQGGIPIMVDESVRDHASLVRIIQAECADFVKFGIKQVGGMLASAHMLATAEAAGLPVVLGHGFGLDPSTMAEIMLSVTSANVVPGLECVGPLKVTDSVVTTPIDISSGVLVVPDGPGLGLTLDDAKLAAFAS